MSDFKEYLPSKKFTTILLFIIVIIILFFTVKGVFNFFRDRKIAKGEPTAVAVTVGAITQKDSNNNGIADWEEYLWGLNPNRNGEKNKEFIESKKTLLTQSGSIIVDDSQYITQNELLTRQFFATIVSLQENGQVDDTSIGSLSEAIGQEVKAIDIGDKYSKSMLNIVADSDAADIAYYVMFNSLTEDYADKDLGDELVLIAQGIANKDPQGLYAAKNIASYYKLFGQGLIKISVPSSAAEAHLKLANDYEKVAESIDGLTGVLSDPIMGMKYILSYKKYSDSLRTDLEKLSEILQ